MKLNWKKSEEEGIVEANFEGTLISISDKVFTNKNGTEFRPAIIEMDGKERKASVYEANYSYGMEVGKTYVCRARYNLEEKSIFLDVSHFVTAKAASVDDFDLSGIEELGLPATDEVEAEATAESTTKL